MTLTELPLPRPTHLNARAIAVSGLRVWYHLPFSLSDAPMDLSKDGWIETRAEATLQQNFYFHSFVADAIWDKPTGEKTALFDLHRKRQFEGTGFEAHHDSPALEKDPVTGQTTKIRLLRRQTFTGKVRTVELRRLRPALSAQDTIMPGFGMLVVGVEYSSVRSQSLRDGTPVDGTGDRPLTLADAQEVLDLSRRIFPRWHSHLDPSIPGDALTMVSCAGPAPTLNQMDAANKEGRTALMPWVAALLKPYTLSDEFSQHFGDERSFITSCLILGSGNEGYDAAFNLLLRVKDSDLLRLAEVDRSGTSYAYSKSFLDTLAPGYFYRRHAPDADSRTGNTSLFITAQNHFGVLATGGYAKDVILGNGIPGDHDMGHVEEYYRHMQFLCVFEYFRLIQFSKRLTQIVRDSRGGTDMAGFQGKLKSIRAEFLHFTHLHHFSNISLQLQPREIFAQLYAAFGIAQMFAEVEKELEAATSFQEMRDGADDRRNAAQLNRLISVGVPLSLIVGAGGMNILVGDKAPLGLGQITDGHGVSGIWAQLAQIALLISVIGGIWGFSERHYTGHKGGGLWLFIAAIAAMAALVFVGLGAFLVWS